jgi:hypothetical protein
MSKDEVTVWETIAQKCREGIKPTIAADALGLKSTYLKYRRELHPVAHFINSAWAEGQMALLDKIRGADSWQAAAWMAERQNPEEFAIDSAIRGVLTQAANEAGFATADFMDAVRMIQDARESGVDLAEVLKQAKVDLHGAEPETSDQSPFQAP